MVVTFLVEFWELGEVDTGFVEFVLQFGYIFLVISIKLDIQYEEKIVNAHEELSFLDVLHEDVYVFWVFMIRGVIHGFWCVGAEEVSFDAVEELEFSLTVLAINQWYVFLSKVALYNILFRIESRREKRFKLLPFQEKSISIKLPIPLFKSNNHQ